MLQILRNKAQSTIIQAIVVIIALVFIFWGVGANMMNNREAAITVNGEEISFQDFQTAYDRAYQQMSAQFGGTLSKEAAESLGIKQQVINQLIQTALLRQGASEMGLIVSEEEIQNTITSMVQFQEGSGFSMEKYKALLTANRLTPHKFETNMRFEMLAEKTIRDIGKFAALANEYEIQELYRQDNEKVSVDYVRIRPADFEDKVEVNEEELTAWYETSKERYKTEPQMKLKFFNYSYSEVGKKVSIDENQIQSYYENNMEQFTTPEQRRARHILIQAGSEDSDDTLKAKEKRASEILALVKASDDFASVARSYSEGPSKTNGGDLGFFTREQMVKPFADAVFSMKEGEVSDLVKTNFGFHIIKLEEIIPAQTKSLDEAKSEIIATLQNKEAQPLAFQLANNAYEGIIKEGSLQAYADANPDQPLVTTDYFKKSSPPDDLSVDGEFLEKAFSLKAGELSSLVKTGNGYYIIYAEDVREPEIPALDDVREVATKEFIADKARELAQAKAENILEELQAGKTFSEALNNTDLELRQSGLMDRRGETETEFPASLISKAFMLSKAEPLPETPAPVNGDFYVFSFLERQVPQITGNEDLEKYRQQLLGRKQQLLLSAYLSNLQKDAEITVHKSL